MLPVSWMLAENMRLPDQRRIKGLYYSQHKKNSINFMFMSVAEITKEMDRPR